MDAPEIVFDPEPHTYTVDGKLRVSVTEVLKDLGFIDFSTVPEPILKAAQRRGLKVHDAVYLLEDDIRYYDEVERDILPYCDAYLEMKEATGWAPRLREHIIFDSTYNYAGTLDGLGAMSKLGIEEVLPDYKSGVPGAAARWQTAGYAGSETINKPLIPRCSIRLKPNGKYSLEWYRDREHKKDVQRWRCIVSTYHLKNGGY